MDGRVVNVANEATFAFETVPAGSYSLGNVRLMKKLGGLLGVARDGNALIAVTGTYCGLRLYFEMR
ncbi:hypothetical protein [Rhizobium leguminosarum]